MTAPSWLRLCALPECAAPLSTPHPRRLYCNDRCKIIAAERARSSRPPIRSYVSVGADVYEALRVVCSRRGLSMRKVVEGLIDEAVAK